MLLHCLLTSQQQHLLALLETAILITEYIMYLITRDMDPECKLLLLGMQEPLCLIH
jgi:hypothetical protein